MRFSIGTTVSRVLCGAGLAAVCCMAGPARADKIRHPTAVFAGLDKITGRIIAFDVAVDETVQFGSLQVTPRVCYTRPQTEAPQTDGFVEVDEIQDDHKFKRIFSGWMFAASPGLHGVEHPVYDVWLTDCKGGSEVIHTTPEAAGDTEPPPNADVRTGAQAKPARRKVEPSGQPAPGRAIQTPADMPPGSPIANPARSTPSPASPVQDAPRRAPTRRYYPSDPLSGAADPAGH